MKIIIGLLLALSIFAQDRTYTGLCETSSACTIQQPASPSKTIALIGFQIKCPTTCTVTLEHHTAGATSTAVTPAGTSPQGVPAASAGLFKNSNVATGTAINKFTPSTGSDFTVRFEPGTRINRTAGLSYTVRPSTSDTTITWVWKEE